MTTIFFPSCKARQSYPASHKKFREYMQNTYDLKPIGCCKINNSKLTEEDTAVILCLNCERVIKKEANYKDIKFVWKMIDEDPSFTFPDYHGEKMTLQHCHIANNKDCFKDTIRSLLNKMNIEIVEEIGEDDHCPSTEIIGYHLEKPYTKEECKEHFTNRYKNVSTDKIISYCKYCNDGVNYSTHQGLHILELLFPE